MHEVLLNGRNMRVFNSGSSLLAAALLLSLLLDGLLAKDFARSHKPDEGQSRTD